MIVVFNEEYLQALYCKGISDDKKHRFQPWIIVKYQSIIKLLIHASSINVIKKFNSLNYEELKGDKNRISSIRLNKQYRILLTVKDDSERKITICNIIGISNHYK